MGIVDRRANTDVLIEGDKIVKVSKNIEAPGAEIIDVTGKVIVPGFVDPHTHLVWAGSREHELEWKLEGKTYQDILANGGGILRTVKETRSVDEEELQSQTLKRFKKAMSHGTTTIEIKSGYGLEEETELKQLRVANWLKSFNLADIVVTFMGAHAFPENLNKYEYVEEVIRMLPLVKDLAEYCDVFCEEGAFTVDESREILEAAKDVHGITVRTANISRKIIENSKNLKVVSRHGVGYDSIDVDALDDCGIPLAIAAHSNMISVAEHAMFMLLALSKNVFYYDKFARKADWSTRWDIRAWDLAEKNLLVIGFGRIGSRLVKRALAFDMKVFVYDPYVDASEIKKSGASQVNNFLDILPQMDAVSLHCPKNEETTNMFSENEFKIMKESAFLINCARGGIVNEVALLDALKSNKIRAAGLDVYDDEPSTSSNPLFSLDNILLSPHIAGVTQEATIRMSKQAVQNVLDVFDDRADPEVIINKNVL